MFWLNLLIIDNIIVYETRLLLEYPHCLFNQCKAWSSKVLKGSCFWLLGLCGILVYNFYKWNRLFSVNPVQNCNMSSHLHCILTCKIFLQCKWNTWNPSNFLIKPFLFTIPCSFHPYQISDYSRVMYITSHQNTNKIDISL